MNDEIYFIKLAAWLVKTLGEGSKFLIEMDTDAFGIHLPETITQHPGVKAASQAVNIKGTGLAESSAKLETAVESGDNNQILSALIKLAENLIAYCNELKKYVSEIDSQINSSNIPDHQERTIAQNFVAQLGRRIIDYMIINAIESTNPQFALILKIIGLIEWTEVKADPENPLSTDHYKKSLDLHFFKDFISDPIQHLIDRIGWGSNDFNPADIFYTIEGFYDLEDDISVGVKEGEPYLQRGVLTFIRDSTQSPAGLIIELKATLDKNLSHRVNLSETWGIGIDSDIQFKGGVEANIRPPFSLSVSPEEGEIKGIFKLFLNRNEEARPFNILGGNSILSLSAEDTSIGLGMTATADTVAGTAEVQPLFFSDIKKLTLKINPGEGDGFITTILSNAKIEGEFDVGLEWRGDEGLVIKASGGIEILIPLHKNLGFIEFDSVFIAVRIKPDAVLELEASTIFSVSLGPLSASVERMGILGKLSLAEGSDSKFGFFDLGMDFKPPNGVGLAIDAGVVTGGGYLYFDFENEEYAGALELTFSDFLSLKAIGLITTRMPDGSKGFSLLVIITAEFTIQLGYGFVFLGAGGLLGLHRIMKLEPLAEGVRTGATANIMFPTNIVENAPQIISDLKRFFPVEEGIFLIGPMAKLGWGTPTLISISMGIVIEIRTTGNGGIERIAILGVLKCILPDEKAALLVLQVNFIGAIDFQKKNAFFFASTFESRVLFITIEGEMGVLVAWGDDANFVVSVGGFHPRFNPPPLPFPVPKRVALNILNKSWGKIRVEGYFAVTTNTAQFGSKIEVYFGFSAFKIQGHLAFDALFQFNPFYFIIEISGKVSLKVFGAGLFSISLKFSLEGTSPWRAIGYGKVKILFITFKARFDKTWGEEKNTQLPPIQVIPILRQELDKTQNWQAITPAANHLLVTLRELHDTNSENTEEIVLHPVGSLRVSQRAVPLKINLDKVGNQKPDDANKLDFMPTGSFAAVSEHKENFARAQYQNMDNSKKLSSPAYEKETGGYNLSVNDDQIKFGKITVRHVRYELITIDSAYKRFKLRFFSVMQVLFVKFLTNSAVAKAEMSYKHKKEFRPFDDKIDFITGNHSVAFTKDNKPYNDKAMNFSSHARAEEYMNTIISENQVQAADIHVLPNNEVNV